MTDFTKRVSYRGFDVTKHFLENKSKQQEHVVGITLGSGWWDGRPLTGGLVKYNFLPQGPLTTIAELHVTFDDGSSVVKIPTGASEDWQMAKGFIRDSDLFTGDAIARPRYSKCNERMGFTARDKTGRSHPALYKSALRKCIPRML